ncbi:MAG: DUF1045 domain-containing protein [Pseudomonadota bacterium]
MGKAVDGFERYAIYFLPEGDLGTFGASWLGWDIRSGAAVPHPQIPGLPVDPDTLTRRPRKYGFHATIKPPFRLAAGKSATELHLAASELCRGLRSIVLDGLQLTQIGPFLALCPTGDDTALNQTAADIVRRLDGFRAPPGIAELTRRRAAGLSPAQEAHLRDWGYPYVMEEFRFHITLTGPLRSEIAEATITALEPVLAPLLTQPYRIDAICLAGSDRDGRFHLLRRYPLAGPRATAG